MHKIVNRLLRRNAWLYARGELREVAYILLILTTNTFCRFERQLEEERKCFDEQRQKLVDDFNAERIRLQNELKMKDADFQVRRQELQREKEIELEQTVAELQEKMFKQEEKYQVNLTDISVVVESLIKLSYIPLESHQHY